MDTFWDWIREHLTDWGIAKVYLACAAAGGTVMLAQFGLNVFGLGGGEMEVEDADVADEAGDAGDSGGGLHLLTVRTLSSFLTLFGLVGWGGTAMGWGHGLTAVVAGVSGLSTMFFVAIIMRSFQRLDQAGNLDPAQAVGKIATVYLRIPAAGGGQGKITVSLQGRTAEFQAVTKGAAIPTGAMCRVSQRLAGDLFEVEPV